MGDKTARQGTATVRRFVGLVSASLAWALVVAFSPWLPGALGVVDLTGITVVLSMLICGFGSSLALGALIGRARAWWLLAACGAAGPSLWILEFTDFTDSHVDSSDLQAVAFAGALAFFLVMAPLAAGAAVGRFCRRPGATP